MTPEQEKVWGVLKTSADELRQQFVVAEFQKMIEDKIAKLVDKEADRVIYSDMVKSYYDVKEDDELYRARILDNIKNTT